MTPAWVQAHRRSLLIALGLVVLAAAMAVPLVQRLTRPTTDPLPLSIVATVGLPGHASRFDYADLDPAAHRLFVAHMGDGTLLAVDTRTDRVVATVPELPSGTGGVAAPALPRVFASAPGPGQVATIDEDPPAVRARAPAGLFP